MTTSVSVFPIGILGLGFLGKILASNFADINESWGTWNKNPPPKSALKVFPFDWSSEKSWNVLPEVPEKLVLAKNNNLSEFYEHIIYYILLYRKMC